MDLTASTDVELVEEYRGGDVSAFDELFRRYHGRIQALCVRAVGDPTTADDMVQETFYSVVRSVEQLSGEMNFSAWIHRIASNVCIDELRRRQRRLKRTQSSNAAEEPDDLILGVPDSDPAGDPEAALETERLRQLVWSVAKKLPERQRMVLSLRELQGMSYASIARLMGISDSAVETLLHRARMRFRQEFLLLDGPREDEAVCALVSRLLTSVGWDKLQAPQRSMLEAHIAECTLCTTLLGPS